LTGFVFSLPERPDRNHANPLILESGFGQLRKSEPLIHLIKGLTGFVFSLPERLDRNHANPLILKIRVRTVGKV